MIKYINYIARTGSFAIVLTFLLNINLYSQQGEVVNKWMRVKNSKISNDLIILANSLNEYSPDSSHYNYFNTGTTCYWNGSEWIYENTPNSFGNMNILISAGKDGNIYIGAPLVQSTNDYEVFTGTEWVHVKSRVPYIPGADKLCYDKENNRFILLKGNEPWIYNLD